MNFNETPVSGVKYHRAKRVIIDNKLDAAPVATFINEEVVLLDGGTLSKDLSATNTAGLDLNTTIDVLNPLDDTVVSTKTYGEILNSVYSLLYSVHRYLGV